MKKILFLLSLILLCGKPYAIDGKFAATIDYSFQDHWNKTLGASAPRIMSIDSVFKKQYFFLPVFASDYGLNDQGEAKISYDLKILRPDGTQYFSQDKIPLYGGTVSDKNLILSAADVIKVCFEEADPFGAYAIQVRINDEVTGKSKELKSDLMLCALPPYIPHIVPSDSAFSDYLTNYYRNPRPEIALDYYLYFIKGPLVEKNALFTPLLTGFVEIFKNNKFLFPQIRECFQKQEIKFQLYMLYLIKYSEIAPEDFYAKLDNVPKAMLAKLNKSDLPNPYGEIVVPAQLDMLWNIFSSNGNYAPIIKLIQTLDYVKYKGALEKFKTSAKSEDDKKKAMGEALYNSVVWSMKSNIKQHPLVKEYCEWALKNEELSATQKRELRQILKSK